MTFKEAVRSTPPVSHAFRPGKQALKREHRKKVDSNNTRRFTGSIDLENAIRNTQLHANLWDYGIGFRGASGREVAIWIEVHPASTSEVSTILNKLKWLQGWLLNKAPKLHTLTQASNTKRFFWLATSAGVHIRPGTPQARQLQQAGLDLPRQVRHLR